MTKNKMKAIIAIVLASVILLSLILTILFWGNILVVQSTDDWGNDILTISAVGIETSFRLSNVDAVAISYSYDTGSKVSGFANAKIKVGIYNNTSSGDYYLFVNNFADAVLLVYMKDGTYIVFNCSTLSETQEMYSLLKSYENI